MLAKRARGAAEFAEARNFEREAVVDERALLRDALRRSMGEVTTAAIRTEFSRRVAGDEFIAVLSDCDAVVVNTLPSAVPCSTDIGT